jgi:TP901 family phage tail tape measure protein
MQTLLASLVVSMSVKDAAYKAGMATARREAAKTEQDLSRAAGGMGHAMQGAARQVNDAAIGMAESLANAARQVQRTGIVMTAAISAPLLLIGKRTKDTAASFETSFNRVRAAMLSASPEQLDKLNAAALRMGPAFGKSASDAALAMEMLAKNGLSASQILGGALTSAMTLSAVGVADLSASADLTTDIMQQFGKSAGQLPDVVNKVTGALDASKLSFDDYRLAIGQTGGVAGGLGYSFEDTNVALAATASLFASGSDAGTSFKTFLTALASPSKEAAKQIGALNLQFFNADGSARSLGEVADELRLKLSDLSDQQKGDALSTIFGNDAMRTAIALMQQGRQGLENVGKAIDAVQAKDKISILQAGDEAASQRLSAALDVLAIKMGEVLLPISVATKDALTGIVQSLSSLSPAFYVAGASAALLASAVGPLVTVIGYTLPLAAALLANRLTGVGAVVGFIINPIGMLVRTVGALLVARGASVAVGLLGARIAAMATPIGLVIGAATILIPLLSKIGLEEELMARQAGLANKVHDRMTSIVERLATATGKAATEARGHAKALIATALAAQQAQLQVARLAVANYNRAVADERAAAANLTPGGLVVREAARQRRQSAATNAWEQIGLLRQGNVDIATVRQAIEASAISGNIGTGGSPMAEPDETDKSTSGRGDAAKSAADAQRANAQYLDDLGRLRVAEMDALADLTEGYRARYRADVANLEEEMASYRRQVALDDELTAAQRAELVAAKEREIGQRRYVVESRMNAAEANERFDLMRAATEGEAELVRLGLDMAETAAERRDGELRLLALQRKLEEAELDRVIAVAAIGSVEAENARRAKERLGAAYSAREARLRRDTAGPGEQYLRAIDLSAGQLREATEDMGVSALVRFNDTLADTAVGFLKMGGVAGQVFNQLFADLMRLQLQKAVLQPIASFLFGGGGGLTTATAQGGVTSFLDSYIPSLNFGGGKASGGRVSPRSWYMVGENGPEPFVPDTAGTIIPNSGLKKLSGGAPVIQIVADEGAMFVPRVQSISGEVSVQTVGAANASMVRMQRRRLGRGG